MSRLVVITPPDPLAVLSIADAKAHLKLAGDDDYVEALIAAAVAQLDGPDGWLGRALAEQTLELRFNGFSRCGDQAIYLPCEPVRSITSVTYVDSSGADVVMAGASYRLIGQYLQPARATSWPATYDERESVRIRYAAGYVSPPAQIVQALKLMVGRMYGQKGTEGRLRKKVVEGVGSREFDVSTAFDELADRAVTNLLMPLRIYQS